jgi:hypothetical protein
MPSMSRQEHGPRRREGLLWRACGARLRKAVKATEIGDED